MTAVLERLSIPGEIVTGETLLGNVYDVIRTEEPGRLDKARDILAWVAGLEDPTCTLSSRIVDKLCVEYEREGFKVGCDTETLLAATFWGLGADSTQDWHKLLERKITWLAVNYSNQTDMLTGLVRCAPPVMREDIAKKLGRAINNTRATSKKHVGMAVFGTLSATATVVLLSQTPAAAAPGTAEIRPSVVDEASLSDVLSTLPDEISSDKSTEITPIQPETAAIIDGLSMSPSRKVFVKNLIGAVMTRYAEGAQINPRVLIAQGILESSWGESTLASKYNNLFGIKAGSSYTGKTVSMKTNEVVNGKTITITAVFRAHDSLLESVDDYITIMNQKNFTGAVAARQTDDGFLQGLKNGGYATDPDYASKITRTIKANKLADAVKSEAQKRGVDPYTGQKDGTDQTSASSETDTLATPDKPSDTTPATPQASATTTISQDSKPKPEIVDLTNITDSQKATTTQASPETVDLTKTNDSIDQKTTIPGTVAPSAAVTISATSTTLNAAEIASALSLPKPSQTTITVAGTTVGSIAPEVSQSSSSKTTATAIQSSSAPKPDTVDLSDNQTKNSVVPASPETKTTENSTPTTKSTNTPTPVTVSGTTNTASTATSVSTGSTSPIADTVDLSSPTSVTGADVASGLQLPSSSTGSNKAPAASDTQAWEDIAKAADEKAAADAAAKKAADDKAAADKAAADKAAADAAAKAAADKAAADAASAKTAEQSTSPEDQKRAVIVKILESQLGTKENPYKCDAGNPSKMGDCGEVSKYTQGRLEYWCADFATWVQNQAGVPVTGDSDSWRIAGVGNVATTGQAHGLYRDKSGYTPKPGDMILFKFSDGTTHIATVVSVSGNQVTYIGGNQAPAGQNGSAVTKETTTLNAAKIWGYVQPNLDGIK